MANDSFGSTTNSNDPYGYFASARTAAPTGSSFGTPAAPSQFGGAPAAPSPAGGLPASGPFGGPPTTNQFGTPGSFGQPMSTPAHRPRGHSKGIARVAMVVIAAVLLIGGTSAYRAWQHMRPLTLPTTVDGLPVLTDSRVIQAMDGLKSQMSAAYPGIAFDVQAYGTDLTKFYFVLAARDSEDISRQMMNLGAGNGTTPVQAVGDDQCASASGGRDVVCARSAGGMTMAVVAAQASGAPPQPEAVAAVLDEVWPQV